MATFINKSPLQLNTGSNIGVDHEAIRHYRRDNPQASVKAVAYWAQSELKLNVDVSEVYQILIGGNDDYKTGDNVKVDFYKTWPMSHNKSAIAPISRPCLSNTLCTIYEEYLLDIPTISQEPKLTFQIHNFDRNGSTFVCFFDDVQT